MGYLYYADFISLFIKWHKMTCTATEQTVCSTTTLLTVHTNLFTSVINVYTGHLLITSSTLHISSPPQHYTTFYYLNYQYCLLLHFKLHLYFAAAIHPTLKLPLLNCWHLHHFLHTTMPPLSPYNNPLPFPS